MKRILRLVSIHLLYLMTLMRVDAFTGLSYNQPTFTPCAVWNPRAVTFANNETLSSQSRRIFVTTDNTLYATLGNLSQVVRWPRGNMSIMENLALDVNATFALFVRANNEIYIDDGNISHVVTRWSMNGTNRTVVMSVSSRCVSLFIDINNTLYCSKVDSNQVMKISLYSGLNNATVAAGTNNGTAGSSSDALNFPNGLFVDAMLNLYVADYNNNRIQLFQPNNRNGTTVAGTQSANPFALHGPTDIVLDTHGYMYIADYENHRIVASGPEGFRCLVGCTGVGGSASDQLNHPYSLAFDNHGNLFVADRRNNRIQKFLLATNSCEISYDQPQICSSATWRSNAITFANVSGVGSYPLGIFVNTNNTVSVAATQIDSIQIWAEGSANRTQTINVSLFRPASVFAMTNGDIYVDNGNANFRVDRWSMNETSSAVAMYVNASCSSLFVDLNDDLYCSLNHKNVVVKNSPKFNTNISLIVAGNGSGGSTSAMLQTPRGIFVDRTLNLYVADCNNDRIQLFQPGNATGTTIAGNGSANATMLSRPMTISFDADDRMYVLEFLNSRIVKIDSNGMQCIAACTNSSGSAANQLNGPWSFNFDSYGNLFVADQYNDRIQKFVLEKQSCDETTTSGNIITSDGPTTLYQSKPAVPLFQPICLSPSYIGSNCTVSSLPCDTLRPCQNNGNCMNDNTALRGYQCRCLPGFGNTNCEDDYQPCQPSTCLNQGLCNQTSNTTFTCQCAPGWSNNRCQTRIDYCGNQTCSHNGVCQSTPLDYICRCFDNSYTGRDCQTTSRQRVLLQAISKSFAYITIIAMGSVAVFVFTLDVLKYACGIDPVHSVRGKRRRPKQSKHLKARRPAFAVRFIYVNAPGIVDSRANETSV